LPPEELFQRILAQINRSKRDILHDKYTQCKLPTTSVVRRGDDAAGGRGRLRGCALALALF
jgi:hypothetical protein